MPRLTRSPSAAHSELYTITDPDLDQVFGQEVLGLADLDGDGVRDFAVADSNLVGFGIGRVNVYSGATGAVLWTLWAREFASIPHRVLSETPP